MTDNSNYYPSVVLKDLASLQGLDFLELIASAQTLTHKYGADQLVLLGAATLGDHLAAADETDREEWFNAAPAGAAALVHVVRTMIAGASPAETMAYIRKLSPRESAETILGIVTCFSHPNFKVELPSEEKLAEMDDDVARRIDAAGAFTEEQTPEAS